jgi:hypothetical protein
MILRLWERAADRTFQFFLRRGWGTYYSGVLAQFAAVILPALLFLFVSSWAISSFLGVR